MVKNERNMPSAMFLMVASMALSFSLTLAYQLPPLAPSPHDFIGLLPPLLDKDVEKCWSSIESVSGCVSEIYASVVNGKIVTLGSACCKAISDISDKCWPKMFPFNPLFPPLLKGYCATVAGPTLSTSPRLNVVVEVEPSTQALEVASKLTSYRHDEAGNPPFGLAPDVTKCFSSLQSIEGCVQEVITSFLTFQLRPLGPACCKAITTINDNCWPKMFPFNPFFPPFVKNQCANLGIVPNSIP